MSEQNSSIEMIIFDAFLSGEKQDNLTKSKIKISKIEQENTKKILSITTPVAKYCAPKNAIPINKIKTKYLNLL